MCEIKNFDKFLKTTFLLNDEETAALHHQIPMTQEMFGKLTQKLSDIGDDVAYFQLLEEFPEMVQVFANKIIKEVDEWKNLDSRPIDKEVNYEAIMKTVLQSNNQN